MFLQKVKSVEGPKVREDVLLAQPFKTQVKFPETCFLENCGPEKLRVEIDDTNHNRSFPFEFAVTFRFYLSHIVRLHRAQNRNLLLLNWCRFGASSSLQLVEMEGCDYEVFLSFRGPDTRTGFTDHLYTRLTDAGVRTYRDDEDLRIGEEIGPDLLRAIEQSKISIPIFSKNYASSKWCLKELAQMVECWKGKEQVIMPIFYYVEPSEVRYQTGGYGEALLVHENKKRVDDETIRKWRAALNEVGGLKGWNVENVANRHEGQLVKQVVTSVLNELKKAYLVVSDFLVGVDDSVKEVLGMIGTDTDDAKIVGIHGMGGIGKTTLAKVVYNKLSRDFANCCFLADVKTTSHSKGIVWLQTQLISDLSRRAHPSNINCIDEGIRTIEGRFSSKKVLILLDDVDEKSQLIALLGRPGCFGPGSRILITTRKANILRAFEVKLTYLVGGLDPDRSLQLFSKHVFRRDQPPIEKVEQSREIVKIAEGLPLILEVMGSTLSICGQKEEIWDDYLVKWKKGHIEGIGSKLMISYEALDFSQRQIFLDIACLFDGYDKSIIIYMWRDCGLCPIEGLEVLQLMSLIKIEDNKLWMHDQLKDLGREIVAQESGGELNKQSRLWNHKDALEMLLREKRNADLEALCLKFENWSEYHFNLEGFAALPNLRFLHVRSHYNAVGRLFSQATLLWHNKSLITSPTDFSLSENQLLPNLRWLSWHNFPRRILKISNFSLLNLVILDFSWSKITHGWDGWRHIKRAQRLKVLDLSNCRHLTRTPDFSGLHTLERLILDGCYKLAKIDSSIGHLKRLVFLNLRRCENLRHLPKELGELSALTELLLDYSGIQEILNWWGMENLGNPHVQISPSAKTGDSLNCLTSLLTLSLNSTQITHLPDSIGALTNLKSLSLRCCFKMPRLPHSIKKLRSLTELDLSCTSLIELPDSLECLENLKALKLCFSKELVIAAMPKLPESLTSLVIYSFTPIAIPHRSNLINLKLLLLDVNMELVIPCHSELVQVPMPWCIGRLSKLEVLTLSHPSITDLALEDFGALPHLKTLRVLDCLALECISQIPSSVTELHIGGCLSLTTLDISYLKNLSELYVFGMSIEELSGRELLDNLLEWKINKDYGLDEREIFEFTTWGLHIRS